MAIEILVGELGRVEYAALVCTGSNWAFGPLFTEEDGKWAGDIARAFLDWLPLDPREYEDHALESRYNQFMDKKPWRTQNDDGKR